MQIDVRTNISIFFIKERILELELDQISHKTETSEEDDRGDTRVDDDGFSLFHTILVSC
jgi:hypothetical protein